jgi:hypothetical protein
VIAAAGSIFQSNFTSNKAMDTCASMFVGNMVQLRLADNIFIANEAQKKGGALGISGNASVLGHTILFAENESKDRGGSH